jgi:hypothetical protein
VIVRNQLRFHFLRALCVSELNSSFQLSTPDS